MADDEERRQPPTKARRGNIRPPQDDPAVSESVAREIGASDTPGTSASAADPVVPASRDEAEAQTGQATASSATDTTSSPLAGAAPSPEFSPGRVDPALEDAFAANASQSPQPTFAEEAVPSGGSRSGAITALFGIALLLLLAGVSYLFYARQDDGVAVEARVADLTRRLAAFEARPVPPVVDITGMTARLEGSEQDLAKLNQAVTGLQSRLDSAESRAKATDVPAQAAQGVDLAPQIAALDTKVASAEREIAEIRAAVASLPKPDFAPVEGKINDVDQRLGALQKTVEDLPRIDLAPLSARLDTIEGRVKPIEGQVAAASAPDRVAQIRAAPLATTAESVRRAIDAGRPFQAEVEALRRLGADGKLIDPLQALAANGAPTLSDLRSELATLRDRMLAGSAPVASGSYLDRLITGASSLVKVRPLGSVVGDAPAAVMARIDAALAGDDLAAVLTEWEKLPEPARAVSKGLADRVRLRLAAETAARAVAADAIQAMTAAKE